MATDTTGRWATVGIQLIGGLVAFAAAAVAVAEVIAIIPGLDGSTGMNSHVDFGTVLVIQGLFGLPAVVAMAATSVHGVLAVREPSGLRLLRIAQTLGPALLIGALWFYSSVGAYGS
jgi:hypothetical protein